MNGARDRRIFIQGPVGSDLVVIAGIGFQDSAQMRLAQDDEMIHGLAPDRADQPFGKAILAINMSRMKFTKWRARSPRSVADKFPATR